MEEKELLNGPDGTRKQARHHGTIPDAGTGFDRAPRHSYVGAMPDQEMA